MSEGGAHEKENIRLICSEAVRILRENASSATEIDPTLIAYVVKAASIGGKFDGNDMPDLGADVLSNADFTALVHFCVRTFSGGITPRLALMSLQLGMKKAFGDQKEVIENEQREHDEELGMTLRSILAHRKTHNSPEQMQRLHARLLDFVTIKNYLQSHLQDPRAEEEFKAALESAFPYSLIARFLTLNEVERRQQLDELSGITLGICLFNTMYGESYMPIQATSPQHANRARKMIAEAAAAAESIAQSMSDIVDSPSAGTSWSVSNVAFRAQALQYYRILQKDLEAALAAMQDVEAEVTHVLAEVHDAVQASGAAVPKEQCFPKFAHVAGLHLLLTEERRQLVSRQRLLSTLGDLYTAGASLLPPETEEPAPEEAGPAPPADAAAAAAEGGAERLPPGERPGEVELGGFCPVACVRQRGMLQFTDPAVGYVAYQGKTYGFSSEAAAEAFMTQPAEFVAALTSTLAGLPEYAMVLQDSVPEWLEDGVVAPLAGAPLKCDFGTQTPTHFVEKHIDVHYEWSEWALRRRALALANMRNKATHGMQTHASHWRRDGDTQTWAPKESATQTRSSKGQTMPKKLRYVTGLRGAPNTKMNVVSLELDVGQPHQH